MQRGPIVYCAEGIDNGGKSLDLVMPGAPSFRAAHREDLLGGVTVLEGEMLRDGKAAAVRAVPYNVWNNRGRGEMAVWISEETTPAQ